MLFLYINNFCGSISSILYLIGQILDIFKIFLPLILIALGILDISRAVISSKTTDVKKNINNLFKKVALCILVYFIPTIGMIVFGFVGGFNRIKNDSGVDFDVCFNCIFNPNNGECTNAIKKMEGN